ncbi:hypothetical protein C8R45DRAFT_935698 [Mycena sanguinolenta]|nr:hypothetical protein C8R45DRAFT_935698 [Mycena sanguinolenta]
MAERWRKSYADPNASKYESRRRGESGTDNARKSSMRDEGTFNCERHQWKGHVETQPARDRRRRRLEKGKGQVSRRSGWDKGIRRFARNAVEGRSSWSYREKRTPAKKDKLFRGEIWAQLIESSRQISTTSRPTGSRLCPEESIVRGKSPPDLRRSHCEGDLAAVPKKGRWTLQAEKKVGRRAESIETGRRMGTSPSSHGRGVDERHLRSRNRVAGGLRGLRNWNQFSKELGVG